MPITGSCCPGWQSLPEFPRTERTTLCCGVGQMETVDGRMIYVVVPDDDSGEEKALEAETITSKPTSEVKQARGWRCIPYIHHVERF